MTDGSEAAPGQRRALWVASRNQKKRAELERMLGPFGFDVRTLEALDEATGTRIELPEDEPDFAGNARSKAVHMMRALVGAGLTGPDDAALGDDSGLCVDALDGRPGVRSARWAGPGDADRNRALLEALEAAGATTREARSAQFACALCVVDVSLRTLAAVEERCHGILLDAPRGSDGFGYDPLFVPRESPPGRADNAAPATFAELTPAEKDAVSHRGRALRSLTQVLGPHRR